MRRSSSRIEPVGPAGEELAEVVDDVAVLVRAHPADAGRGALVDVAEQARPPDLAVPAEHAGAAGAGREHPEQQVERLADRPGVRVRAEVAHPLAAGPAVDVQPRELLTHRHRQHGVGLVVAVADVEPRVELLDPVVLELQRLDLGADHRPLHPCGRGHHLARPRMQVGEVGEVRVQPAAQALGLADVDHAPRRVGEAVDPGLLRDGARGGTVSGGIGHGPSSVGRGSDTPGRHRASRAEKRGVGGGRRVAPRCAGAVTELSVPSGTAVRDRTAVRRTRGSGWTGRRARWGASASCWRGPSGRARPRRHRPARTRRSS